MKIDLDSCIAELKEKILYVFGYDPNLKPLPARSREEIANAETAVSPQKYLQFAVADLSGNDPIHSAVNAYSNCKRAIDRQLEILIGHLGFTKVAKREKWSVPKKIAFVKDSGVIAPRILERINLTRNKLEHDHTPPSIEEAQDAVDVALLFVSYAEIAPMPSLNIAMGSDGGIGVRWNSEEMSFEFYRNRGSGTDRREERLGCKVTYGEKGFDELYTFLTRILPAIDRRRS